MSFGAAAFLRRSPAARSAVPWCGKEKLNQGRNGRGQSRVRLNATSPHHSPHVAKGGVFVAGVVCKKDPDSIFTQKQLETSPCVGFLAIRYHHILLLA